MTVSLSPGAKFRLALKEEKPLQIMGTVNAYCALMAEQIGYRAIYLSGGACSAMSYGLPDLGITSLDNVLEDVMRITSVSSAPLLVDIDTGWGGTLNVEHTIKQMIKAGVAAVHIEDQAFNKRCGHREGKLLVLTSEMVARIKAAVDARTDPDFYIIARTDAVANEGLEQAIDRANAYIQAGADAIFAEALTSLKQYEKFCAEVNAPVLANMTEFGKTPLLSIENLRNAGVSMVLYPLTAVRAMNAAAEQIYRYVRLKGVQKDCLNQMQDREILYNFLKYKDFEEKIR